MNEPSPSKPRVVVVGCGAIGGVLSVHLLKAPVDLSIVTTNEAVRRVWVEPGPRYDGHEVGVRLPPTSVLKSAEDANDEFDYAFIAVQPTQIDEALVSLAPKLKDSARVICLPNGLCEERLARALGSERIIGAVVAWGARMKEPGHYVRTSSGGFRIGRLDGKDDPELGRIAGWLESIGPVQVTQNLRGARFSKLALNCAVSTLGTIGGRTLGELLVQSEARDLALNILREAVEVAEAEGIELEPVTHLDLRWLRNGSGKGSSRLRSTTEHALLLAVGLRYRKLRSSMLSAVERGRAPAVDFLNGEIVERGRLHNIPTPFNEAARATVWDIAEGRLTAGPDALKALRTRASR